MHLISVALENEIFTLMTKANASVFTTTFAENCAFI